MVLGYVHIGMTLGTGANKDDGAFGLGRNPPLAFALSRLASIKRDIDHALC